MMGGIPPSSPRINAIGTQPPTTVPLSRLRGVSHRSAFVAPGGVISLSNYKNWQIIDKNGVAAPARGGLFCSYDDKKSWPNMGR